MRLQQLTTNCMNIVDMRVRVPGFFPTRAHSLRYGLVIKAVVEAERLSVQLGALAYRTLFGEVVYRNFSR